MRTLLLTTVLALGCNGDTETDTDAGTEPGTDIGTDIGTEADTDTDTDTDSDIDTDEVMPTVLQIESVGTGFSAPVGVFTRPGNDSLWVVEQTGTIRPITAAGTPGTPLLDVSSRISTGSEQGLLGLAFPPDHDTTGRFYVHYTRRDGDSVLARYTLPTGEVTATDDDREVLWTVEQPFVNHNAGHIAFGPDGYLYVGYGDGGSANDPNGAGQDPTNILGTMLRVDVSGATGFTSPATNPFTGDETIDDRIWAIGLRNPWKFAFDSVTGDLIIADVGQREWEEISVQPQGSTGGDNYGWNTMEGTHCFVSANCDTTGLVLPVHEYDHGDGCSITGGEVYHGTDLTFMDGAYFFSDYCTNRLWTLRIEDGVASDFQDWTDTLNGSLSGVSSFGLDNNGEMLVISRLTGQIHRITEG